MNSSVILAALESTVLTTEGPPVLKFINATIAAQGDPLKEAAALAALQGDVIGAAPQLEAGLITQILGGIASKLAAKIAAAQSATTPKT